MKDINAYLQTDDIHSVFIAPDVSDKTLLYIMFSDFVRLKQGLIRALKVKCLALDLDETIWKGVLIEDGPSGVEVNQELISYLQRFKEKGVILSVISKNNFDQAMPCLRQHQLENLFVFPQISWEPKSINLKRLANALGIDSGAIVLVDDSSFERAEVETNFNSVRTIHPDEVGNFYNSKEVQEMVITNDSAKRTEYYKTEEARQKALQDTGNKEELF